MANWNKHHGVGATLIENWVEEQAVGDLIISERSDVRNLSRDGHKDIIFQSNAKPIVPMISTSKEAYSAIPLFGSSKPSLGKRRQFMEAEMLKIAISDQQEQPLVNSSKMWQSTTMHDFAHTDIYPPLNKLGSKLPDQDQLDKFDKPITFWSDYAAKGSGTAICSIPAQTLHTQGFPGSGKRFDNKVAVDENQSSVLGHRAGQIHEMDASNVPIRFGKHPMFSTPIHESKYDEA
ncbi:hypothetical protein BASA50_009058 [Batrachochytrium salamandrivorans]|uniref:Uncharacterized protein n=1 Tax=Batrachochytrium salamandrivorans TaxID=1357716 RepID=A0ABQ8F5L8_9FUNG|nr:hypothetical protein BASA50_009058 [Batrachochytrium salamandrivorans]KAH9268890.1 hypothetical protein BASA84_000010 [Batrachochytrium salamandrivorans]